MENGEISYCRRYVDDIIIIFNQNKINEELFTNYMNNTHKHLEFKLTEGSTHTQGFQFIKKY